MPQTNQKLRSRPSTRVHIALTERAIKGLNKSIDEDIARARDLEMEHDLALYRAGKNPVCDGEESIREARKRVG